MLKHTLSLAIGCLGFIIAFGTPASAICVDGGGGDGGSCICQLHDGNYRLSNCSPRPCGQGQTGSCCSIKNMHGQVVGCGCRCQACIDCLPDIGG